MIEQHLSPASTPPLLQTRGITKSFGQVKALAGVSVSIARGETVAIMGPSGSGKSTLLHCLSGVLLPDQGEVVFDGQIVSALKDRPRSHLRLSRFGFVFQDGQLIPELTARENVALPLMLTGTPRGKAMNAADDMLGRLGLAELRTRRPGDMSGGQAQRTAIARALVTHPSVVFADEPSGALDQATGHEMMQILTATVAMAGASLVLVTHDINVARWCGRLLEIRDGLVHTDRRLEPIATAAEVLR
ncbi:MAG: ABC transporter ATP-binding protein [Propioniciclava sp.]|uniref:ABC transporter ATP-binding protein n=1 Tax=Propioniciclava sp. TaxID=2038686 RepID=UPI0039E63F10